VSVSLDPVQHTWMTDAKTRAVMHALTENGGDARFVGGAVRNALLGMPVTDVDIATPLLPGESMRRLQAAGLGVAPTGIEHGTVTAICKSTPYEVTTLRRDVSTDGRRAVVAFTRDWKEDAARRDFTMNALYADESGKIYDYFGGIADLRAGKVRFVGDPRTRIREDYLRILRLFRFHAWYGKGEIDAEALAAAAAEKAGLKTLSGERVQKELLRLLEAPDPVPVLREMEKADILSEILPQTFVFRLSVLLAREHKYGIAAEPMLRLAALVPYGAPLGEIASRFRLSNADRDRLVAAHSLKGEMLLHIDEVRAHKLIYETGPLRSRDALIVLWVQGDAGHWWDDHAGKLLKVVGTWNVPKFPLDGRDAKAAGVSEGPRVGAILKELEQWWIENDFVPDRNALLARLNEAIKS
jgi:poly(A) polymerase